MKKIHRLYSGIGILFAFTAILFICVYYSSDRFSPLMLQYHYSTETIYYDVKIQHTKIFYTHIDEKKIKDRCAQWIKQTPCWTQADLITEESQLTKKEIRELKDLISQSNILQLEPYYGPSQQERCYSYTLKINDKEIVYCSRPGGPPPPDAFAQVSTQIAETVKNLFAH